MPDDKTLHQFDAIIPPQGFSPKKPKHCWLISFSKPGSPVTIFRPVVVCTTRELADKVAFSMEPNGFRNQHTQVADIQLVSDWNDYVESLPETVKRRALSKLTPEEKAALGLTQEPS